MKRCVIISGGEFDALPEIQNEDFVIACDRGYAYAVKENVRPDLVIADFDSFDGAVDEGIPVKKYPCEKDDTDTMAAVKYAVENGASEVVLCCALGGRADHAYANIQSCVYAAEHGLKAGIYGRDEEMRIIKDGEIVLKKKPGFSLSVFSISDRSEGVSITGTKYPLKDAVVTNSFPIGVSNEWEDEEARISVKKGILLVICSRYER
ncbi:MAG: thiamine diphosphokinase [Lachnospiraceae bacterium]|nr:thiamine diphosphokinase [Lachnospiraceae bacterium]